MADVKCDLPAFSGGSEYESWRYQIFGILGAQNVKGAVQGELDGNPQQTTAAQKTSLKKIHGALVAKLIGESLLHAQQSGKENFAGLIGYLDNLYRSNAQIAKQTLLKQLLCDAYDPNKGALGAYLGRKRALVHQRIKTVNIDELLILGITTNLPNAYETILSDLRNLVSNYINRIIKNN